MINSFEEFKEEVRGEFPLNFDDLFIKDKVDGIIKRALKKIYQKTEVIGSKVVSANTVLEDAESIVKLTTTVNSAAYYNVFYYMTDERVRPKRFVNWYWTPEGKIMVELYANISQVYIEYVKRRDMLELSDLPPHKVQLAVEYAVAMMKYQEGMMGTQAKLSDSPFEFNYEQLRDDGKEEKEKIEESLEETYFGLFGGRSY